MKNDHPGGERKLGAVIYLRSTKPLQLAEFASDFGKRWPGVVLKSEGRQGNCVYLRVGDSHIAVEFRSTRVPQNVTAEAISSASGRHWPAVANELAPHQAHMAIAASVKDGTVLNLAGDLTKVVAALLSVSDSIGVCWLNGPVLNPSKEFVGISAELFDNGVLPLMLWIAVLWNPGARLMHTKGMSQFDAPELFLAQQLDFSGEMLSYLFDLASYVLTSGNELLNGETIDGPKGTLRIESLKGDASGKPGLMLFPVQPN